MRRCLKPPWWVIRIRSRARACLRDADGGEARDDALRESWCSGRKEIGPIASPDLIQFAPGLPKTRPARSCAGFCKIAEDDFSNLGDISTLADPAVVDDLVRNRQNKANEA